MGPRAWLAILFVALAGCAAGPPDAEIVPHIQRLQGAAAVGGETLEEPASVRKFYEARGFKPAWLDRADGVVKAIGAMHADGLDPAGYHLEAIQSRLEKRERTAESEAILDLLLADAVASMADDVRYGRVVPSQVNSAWNVDPREGASSLDSTLGVIAKASSVERAIDEQRPQHFIYRGLVSALQRLRQIDQQGGWPRVPSGRSLSAKAVDPRIATVRRRLALSGEYTSRAPADSNRYDPDLVRAVKIFQVRHRLKETGVIDQATTDALNVDAKSRAAQVRANLERARWVLSGLGQDFLLVNLPAFKAYLIRGNKNVWEARTQIGEEAMQTPTFRAPIRTIVFNPDWSVPESILREEIIAQMRKGDNVIQRQGLVIYDASNNVVDPSSIDWANADSTDFPYTLKQPPGDDNALGKVKFLFPNKYAIYLHDTPNQRLFEANRRTFSHGCIRIENAIDLAERLLQGQDEWNRTRIQQAIAQGSTMDVPVGTNLPILIVYWTVSVGYSGEVRYAEDIYKLDAPLLAALDRRSPRPSTP
ncbi:MAG TPA: L,D-transpeptidase family protein [Candidatus Eisenbacteria bacterium]|nr:L,D-transpeptidase family protein [Candidatus Eisenbacteria bacterium]